MSRSGGTSGLVGRFLTGAAAVAVPAALEQQRADIQAKRDQVLNNYRQQEVAGSQAFTTSERKATQQFTSEEGKSNEAFQTSERLAGQTFTAGENTANRTLDSQRIGLLREQLNQTKAGQDIANSIATINLDNAKDQQRVLKLIADPKVDDDTRMAAIETLNALQGKSRKEVQVVKGDPFSADPAQRQDRVAIVDTSTGNFIFGTDLGKPPPPAPGGTGGAPPPKPAGDSGPGVIDRTLGAVGSAVGKAVDAVKPGALYDPNLATQESGVSKTIREKPWVKDAASRRKLGLEPLPAEGAAAQQPKYSTPEDVRSAYRAKILTREEAYTLLEQMGYGQ